MVASHPTQGSSKPWLHLHLQAPQSQGSSKPWLHLHLQATLSKGSSKPWLHLRARPPPRAASACSSKVQPVGQRGGLVQSHPCLGVLPLSLL